MLRRLLLLVVLLAVCLLALPQAMAAATLQGKVTEVIEASGYTYVQIDTGADKVWAAGPVTPIKVGDRIGFSTGMPMMNFHSKSMQRDFAVIYFVDKYLTDASAAMTGAETTAAAHSQPQPMAATRPVTGISKVAGGNTIAEIEADRKGLSGKTVRVRGVVTKFSPNIMGKNWLHIMDSSSQDDLTVTTTGMAAIDDVVVIEGRLELDRDFNYGYLYPLIVEDGTITKE